MLYHLMEILQPAVCLQAELALYQVGLLSPRSFGDLQGSVVTQPEICSRSTTFLSKIGADSEQDLKKKEGIGATKP